jgi:hypothetical protein
MSTELIILSTSAVYLLVAILGFLILSTPGERRGPPQIHNGERHDVYGYNDRT